MVHHNLSLLIIIISIFSLICNLYLLKYLTGTIKYPTISSFFMFKFFVFAYIGSVLLNVFYFEYEMNKNMYSRKDLLLNIWIYTTSALFLMPFGMLIANVAFKYNPKYSIKKFLKEDIHISKFDKSNYTFIILLILFIVSVSVLILYLSKLNTIPIFALLGEYSAAELAYFRSESGSNFDGKYYRYVIFIKTLPIMLLFVLFFLKNISVKWKIFYYVILFYTMFTLLIDLQKAPIIKLILLLLLAYIFVKKEVSLKLLIFIFSSISILLILMYMFVMGMNNLGYFDIFSAIFHRVFITQISGFYFWQLFQENYDYIYGTSFPNPAGIFPFEWRQIAVEIMNFSHPELTIDKDIIGSINTVYFADWFINFGPLMAIFSMILIGFIIQTVDIVFIKYLRNKKSILTSVLFIILIDYFGKFTTTTYLGILIDPDWIMPLFFILVVIIGRQIIKNFIGVIFAKKSNINSIK